jgi:hypothetical protein
MNISVALPLIAVKLKPRPLIVAVVISPANTSSTDAITVLNPIFLTPYCASFSDELSLTAAWDIPPFNTRDLEGHAR